jgi:hypothetical protein
MDPNETLKTIRFNILNGFYVEAANEFRDLDEWLSKGGFLPDDWKTERDWRDLH